MIRIDLGKSEQEREAQSRPSAVKRAFDRANQFVRADAGGYLAIAVAAAFAFLPHLFVEQFRNFSKRSHETQMKEMRETEESLKQEIAKYASFQKELESYEEQKRNAGYRLTTVQQLLKARATPVNVLDAVASSLPTRTWLKSIDLISGKDAMVKVAGYSYTNEEISDFVEKLSESVHVTDVALEEVTVGPGKPGEEIKGFSVRARPKGLIEEATERKVANATEEIKGK